MAYAYTILSNFKTGKTLWQGNLNVSNGAGDLRGVEIPSGVLFLRVSQLNKESVFKVFK